MDPGKSGVKGEACENAGSFVYLEGETRAEGHEESSGFVRAGGMLGYLGSEGWQDFQGQEAVPRGGADQSVLRVKGLAGQHGRQKAESSDWGVSSVLRVPFYFSLFLLFCS